MTAAAIRQRLDFAEETQAAWATPDMSILTGGRSKPPVMPRGLFGDAWPLLQDLAAGAGAPIDYVAIAMLGVTASLIGGKRRVKPYEVGTWTEPAILWTALVGDPSSNKSPALDAVTEPLWRMESEHAERHKETLHDHEAVAARAAAERKLWDEKVKQAAKAGDDTPPMPLAAALPEDPVRRRLLVTDATPEALAMILSGNPTGTLHLSDELAGWLMSFERYSPGGREFWLSSFGGRPHNIDRKGGGGKVISLPFNGVSVVGGIQPEKLKAALLDTVDDGLAPRFLWAFPDKIAYSRPRSVADVGLLDHTYRRLDALLPAIGTLGEAKALTLPLDPGAADVFELWMQEHQESYGEAASLYKGFCGKLPGIVLRLSLISELLTWAIGREEREPAQVGVRSVVQAIEFVEAYAKPSALRVFGDAARPVNERRGAALARHIRKQGLTAFSTREVYTFTPRPSDLLTNGQEVDEAVELLLEAAWIHPAPLPERSPRGGRPPKRFLVNPGVHDGK